MINQRNRKRLLITSIILAMLVCLEGFQAPSMSASTIRVACVGDSITYGYGYPAELQTLLGTEYSVENFGYSGRTAMRTGDKPYVDEEIYQDSLNYLPDIVVIMFGTNDSKVQNWLSKEEFKKQYRELLQSYTQLSSKPVVYLNTPATPFYVDGKMEGPMEFNIQKDKVDEAAEAVRELGKELGLQVLDFNDITKNHPEWFKIDGIHPNADGAKAIAKLAYDGIKK
ncbi:GDSL-type esterase/lipase family protein [Psychrobacillus sp. FJAT-51614]|uniref:GDSL-type esterase/lipase family protein n=1 Tax=Psychrobacillus mangrovi TaxID=3117745 RepID=A0ABU8EZ89_9BACI